MRNLMFHVRDPRQFFQSFPRWNDRFVNKFVNRVFVMQMSGHLRAFSYIESHVPGKVGVSFNLACENFIFR